MTDLSTEYLGLKLKNPLVPSASPLSRHLDTARRLEDAGASALVMHSLFEEMIAQEDGRIARFFHQQMVVVQAHALALHQIASDPRQGGFFENVLVVGIALPSAKILDEVPGIAGFASDDGQRA